MKKIQTICGIFVLSAVINSAIGKYTGPNKIAIVNKEQPYINKTYQPCPYNVGCYFLNLTCSLLDKVVKDSEKEYYVEPSEAQGDLEKGNIWAILYFPSKFTDSLMSRYIFQVHASEKLVEDSQMKVWLRGDYSNYLEDFQQSLKHFAETLINNCGSTKSNLDKMGLLVKYEQVINPKLDKLAVVNEDQPFVSSSYQPCHFDTGCVYSNMSCRFLHTVKHENIEYYPTIEKALTAVQKGDAWGAIHIRYNFSKALISSLGLNYETYYIEYMFLNQIRVWLHPLSEPSKQGLSQKEIQKRFTKVIEDILSKCGRKLDSTYDNTSIVVFQDFNNITSYVQYSPNYNFKGVQHS